MELPRTPPSFAAPVQKALLSTNQWEALYLPSYHNIPNTVTLGDTDSPLSPDRSGGSGECVSGCE